MQGMRLDQIGGELVGPVMPVVRWPTPEPVLHAS